MESIPEDILDNYYLYSIDGRFISEAQYDDVIVSLTKSDNDIDSEENSFVHTIYVKDDEKVCETGKTVWGRIEK